MSTTISLSMIVKNESLNIENVLACAKNICYELIVVDTGSTDDTVQKALNFGAKIYHFSWVDDFAAARNFSLDKCNCDWVMWLDADDIITEENQRKIIDIKENILNDELDAVFLGYDYSGSVGIRERLIRNKAGMRWKNPIHEHISGIKIQKEFPNVFIKHTKTDYSLSMKRNLSIYKRHYKYGENDEHFLYHYARDLNNVGETESAIKIYKEFLSKALVIHYKYKALCAMFWCHIKLDKVEEALKYISEAMILDSTRPEAFLALALYYRRDQNQFDKAISFLHAAAAVNEPKALDYQISDYSYSPYDELSLCYHYTGQNKKALEAGIKALELCNNPKDKARIYENIKLYYLEKLA